MWHEKIPDTSFTLQFKYRVDEGAFSKLYEINLNPEERCHGFEDTTDKFYRIDFEAVKLQGVKLNEGQIIEISV